MLTGTAGYLIPYASMWSGCRLFPFHPLKALFYPLVVIPVFCCMALDALPLFDTRRSGMAWSIHTRWREPDAVNTAADSKGLRACSESLAVAAMVSHCIKLKVDLGPALFRPPEAACRSSNSSVI